MCIRDRGCKVPAVSHLGLRFVMGKINGHGSFLTERLQNYKRSLNILLTEKFLLKDISVLNRFTMGCGHRQIRKKACFDTLKKTYI